MLQACFAMLLRQLALPTQAATVHGSEGWLLWFCRDTQPQGVQLVYVQRVTQ